MSWKALVPGIALLTTAAVRVALQAQRRKLEALHRRRMRDVEILSTAQLRALLAENAVAIGKLAAAVTHEINSPLGALRSSLDTLLVVAARQVTAPPEEQPRLVALQADLRKSVRQSIARLQEVIARLQRFINLDSSDPQRVNINEILSDVAIVFEEHIKDRVAVEFDLQPLFPVVCRPQQMTTVFSTLFSNALNALNGGGRIRISTRQHDGMAEVRIQDNGKGMNAEQLENIFDPTFRVAESRVSTGNWSIFNSRQIVFEHGGDIRFDSAEGQGTTVCVSLPCAAT